MVREPVRECQKSVSHKKVKTACVADRSSALSRSMQSDIEQFLALRESLLQERVAIEASIKEITNVLAQANPAVVVPAPTPAPAPAAAPATPGRKQRKKLSAASRAKIKAAAIARWAKVKGTPAVAAKKPTRKISAAGRASIAAAQKARWAKLKAAKAQKA